MFVLCELKRVLQVTESVRPSNGLLATAIAGIAASAFFGGYLLVDLSGAGLQDSEEIGEQKILLHSLQERMITLEDKILQMETRAGDGPRTSTPPAVTISIDDDPIIGNPDAGLEFVIN